jgi:hypothetical protein
MPSLNAQPSTSSLEFIPQCPDAKIIFLDEKRKQLRGVLTPEQRYISASTLLKGLGPDLARTLGAHYAFSDQVPDPQLVAHARFTQQDGGPDAEPIVFAA